MPYADKEIRNLLRRARDRTKVHGNWRQVVINCNGMCVYKDNGIVCGSTEHLEFHEIYGEDSNSTLQHRILLCPLHHSKMHPETIDTYMQPRKSKLMKDIDLEIIRCGGYDAWVNMYMLDNSTLGIELGD